MKTVFRLMLILLSYLPVNAIAITAKSKLLDYTGEDQTKLLMQNLKYSKNLLFPEDKTITNFDYAQKRIKNLTGIENDAQASDEVAKHLNILLAAGLIQIDESKITTQLTSHMGNE